MTGTVPLARANSVVEASLAASIAARCTEDLRELNSASAPYVVPPAFAATMR